MSPSPDPRCRHVVSPQETFTVPKRKRLDTREGPQQLEGDQVVGSHCPAPQHAKHACCEPWAGALQERKGWSSGLAPSRSGSGQARKPPGRLEAGGRIGTSPALGLSSWPCHTLRPSLQPAPLALATRFFCRTAWSQSARRATAPLG